MSAAALFGVMVIGKLATLDVRALPSSIGAPFALFWQDAVVALAFAVAARAATNPPRRRVLLGIYWLLALYVAINIPIGRALSTPLTMPMLGATGGALADSILLYLTWTNVGLMALTLAAAAVLLPLCGRVGTRGAGVLAACGVVVAGGGLLASGQVDAAGAGRNVVFALAASALPQAPRGDGQGVADWRAPRITRSASDDLSALGGRAAGRHVVLISLESAGAQYLAPWGGDGDVMPALSGLVRDGLVFEHAYAVYPESIKGLLSILCSLAPSFDVEAEAYRDVRCPSLAAELAQAGYRTAMFHSGRFDYLGMRSIIERRGFETLEDAGDIGGNHVSSFGIDEPSTVKRMLSWIDRVPEGERFFLTYLPIAGHHPYDSPGPVFPADTERGRYLNALQYGDDSLAALIEGIRARGLTEKTMWVIYGDHGEAFGQHPGNYGHTFMLYDENVRVPLVVTAPGAIGRSRVERPVSLVDIAPTVLDLLGLTIPSSYEGRSMLDGTPRMALFFTDYSRPLGGLRDGRWKYVYGFDDGRGRLFDLETDPEERVDLSSQHVESALWYAVRLRNWSAAQKRQVAALRNEGGRRRCASMPGLAPSTPRRQP